MAAGGCEAAGIDQSIEPGHLKGLCKIKRLNAELAEPENPRHFLSAASAVSALNVI